MMMHRVMEAADKESDWESVKGVVKSILAGGEIKREDWQNSFSQIHSLSLSKAWRRKLYEHLVTVLESHSNDFVEELLATGSTEFLGKFNDKFSTFEKCAHWLDLLFGHLNRKLQKQARDSFAVDFSLSSRIADMHFCVGDLAFGVWKQTVETTLLLDKLCENFVAAMDQDRCEIGGIESTIAASTAFLFAKLSVTNVFSPWDYYKRWIEEPVVEDMVKRCESLSLHSYSRLTIPEYVQTVTKLVADEKARCKKFLQEISVAEVVNSCLLVFVDYEVDHFKDAADAFLKSESVEDLRSMYHLVKERDLVPDCFREPLHLCVRDALTHAISSADSNPSKLISSFHSTRLKYVTMIDQMCGRDVHLGEAMDTAIQAVVNTSPRHVKKISRMLNVYLDSLLRGNENATVVKQKILEALGLFRYIQDKDIFRELYSISLGRRLLKEKSTALELEMFVVEKLKMECGFEYCRRMEQMTFDIQTSESLNKRFLEGHTGQVTGFTKVLRDYSWPSSLVDASKRDNVVLPRCFADVLQSFADFYEKGYEELYKQRKLTWLHGLGTVEVELSLDKHYLVEMSVFQLTVFAAISESNAMTVKELIDVTKLSKTDVISCSKTLLDAKLLSVDGDVLQDTSLGDGTVLCLNKHYSGSDEKIKLHS